MANSYTLLPTEFKNIRTGESSFGYRFYDNYAATYCNTLGAIPDDDLELLKIVVSHRHEAVQGLIDGMNESQKGLWIGPIFYAYEKIKALIT